MNCKLILSLLSLLAGIGMGTNVSAQTDLWSNIKEKNRPAIVYLKSVYRYPNGLEQPVEGSGFLVDSIGHILTCEHVVSDELKIGNEIVKGATLLSTTASIGGRGELAREVNVTHRDRDKDLAILLLKDEPPESLRKVRIDLDSNVDSVGELYALGFPECNRGSLDGVSGAIRSRLRPGENWAMTNPINPGQSGGPVFSKEGRVIGLAKGAVPNSNQMNVVIPVRLAKGWLEEIGVKPDDHSTDRASGAEQRPITASMSNSINKYNPIIRTGDPVIDKVQNRLNVLLTDNGSISESDLTETLAPLFSRPAFYDIREEDWNYFLYALCKSRLILEDTIEYFRSSPQVRNELHRAVMTMVQLQNEVAQLYGRTFSVTEHIRRYADNRDEFVGKLRLLKSPDVNFYEDRNLNIRNLREILCGIGFVNGCSNSSIDLPKDINGDGRIGDLQFDVIDSNNGAISLLIMNKCATPIAITTGWVSSFIDNGPLFSSILDIQKPILVKSGAQDVLNINSYAGVPYVRSSKKSPTSERYKCRVGIKYNRLGKIEEYLSEEFTCLLKEDVKDLLDLMQTRNSQKTNQQL